MIRQSPRRLLRHSLFQPRLAQGSRFVSTIPPAQRPRSWKNTAARWGLAIGIVYYYNTTNLFADEPAYVLPAPQTPTDETPVPTLEEVARSKEKRGSLYPSPPSAETSSSSLETPPPTASAALEDTEDESAQGGAFNEETGEINWDCPCLGGMAHGPCGEHFRTAFSCFVFSKAEPKGMDCIDHFKTMQGCFREHPDIYGAELEEEEEEARAAEAATEAAEAGLATQPLAPRDTDRPSSPSTASLVSETSTADDTSSTSKATSTSASPTESSSSETSSPIPSKAQDLSPLTADKSTKQSEAPPGEPNSESEGILPKAAHDATDANKN